MIARIEVVPVEGFVLGVEARHVKRRGVVAAAIHGVVRVRFQFEERLSNRVRSSFRLWAQRQGYGQGRDLR